MNTKWDKWLQARGQLAAASAGFLAAAQDLDHRLATRKGTCGDWSAKEVVAHIVGWEIEVQQRFRIFRKGSAPDINYDVNAFNQQSVASRKDMSWKEMIEELKSAQQSLGKITSTLSQKEIETEKRFLTWTNIIVRHYNHHAAQIKILAG